MRLKKGQQIEASITNIAFGGQGIAKLNGYTVFVDKAVPGDTALIQITKKKKNYAEAKIVALKTPSIHRIEARCPYSGYCGGCRWQFLDYSQQIAYKRRHVKESIEHIGLVKDVRVHDTIPSAQAFEYRNKMEFSCSERRWLLPEEMGRDDVDRGPALGLHVPGTFSKVIDIETCLLQPRVGNEILGQIRNYIKNSDAPVYGLKSHQGFWRFVVLRNSFAYKQWMVNIVTAFDDPSVIQPLADRLMASFPEIISVTNNITSRKAAVAVGEYERIVAGEEVLRERIGGFEFIISSNSFFQTNTEGARVLYGVAKDYADLTGDEITLDLYSGTGAIAMYLSDASKRVVGIEQVEGSVRDAERNCQINGITNCRFIHGDIRSALPNLTEKPHVMIIDPPRAGMHKDVVKQILSITPERIVYVSCNPATMARDIGMMKDTYGLLEVQPVDMFPHTYHIEAVAKLRKR